MWRCRRIREIEEDSSSIDYVLLYPNDGVESQILYEAPVVVWDLEQAGRSRQTYPVGVRGRWI